MKTNCKVIKGVTLSLAGVIFMRFACFFMYDFYKCLSGFIANGFREPGVMLPMVLSFLLPVVCFLFFFYDVFVKSVHRVGKIVYSSIIIVWGILDLSFIFANISLYASNNRLGVYESLPSFIFHFPYDMIILHFCLIFLEVFNIVVACLKNSKLARLKNEITLHGFFKIKVWEYLLLAVLAIVVFVFAGAGVTATFSAFSNAFYDFRYIFLLLWVAYIPLMNLLFLVIKPEKQNLPKWAKFTILGNGIFINLVFGILLLVFERTYPDFMVHIGKPLFLIAFSVSLPIEMGIIVGIMALGTVSMIVKIILLAVKKK